MGLGMQRIKLLFFATLRERVGMRTLELEVADRSTVKDLKEQLANTYPNLRESLQSVLIAVNHEYALDDAPLPPNAEVALFPPVSGG